MAFTERQLTFGTYGHMLNPVQVFSPDDKWIVYDTRNDQTHIGRTCCIEKVHVESGEIVKLYAAPRQSLFGPGVGAAAYHPRASKIIFIHGLMNADESRPYGFTRRFGAILDERSPGRIVHAEARTVDEPLVEGALRGGTHAHSWSADGRWISFTYNDYLLEQLERTGEGHMKDLRTVGVMAPAPPVTVENESAENFSGEFFSVVAATVTDHPKPGSDEIEKAFDECWIGTNGYVRPDGTRQQRAIAFQGNVRSLKDAVITEVFVVDLPEDITSAAPGQRLCGTPSSRPVVPAGAHQRRVTFTEARKEPGIQGPRAWLRSSPDGMTLYFLMKDDIGVVQVFSVPTNGGSIHQVTRLPVSVEAQFNVSPDGSRLAAIAGGSIWITEINTGKSVQITPPLAAEEAPLFAVTWNNSGNSIAYNRSVVSGGERYLQIFTIALN